MQAHVPIADRPKIVRPAPNGQAKDEHGVHLWILSLCPALHAVQIDPNHLLIRTCWGPVVPVRHVTTVRDRKVLGLQVAPVNGLDKLLGDPIVDQDTGGQVVVARPATAHGNRFDPTLNRKGLSSPEDLGHAPSLNARKIHALFVVPPPQRVAHGFLEQLGDLFLGRARNGKPREDLGPRPRFQNCFHGTLKLVLGRSAGSHGGTWPAKYGIVASRPVTHRAPTKELEKVDAHHRNAEAHTDCIKAQLKSAVAQCRELLRVRHLITRGQHREFGVCFAEPKNSTVKGFPQVRTPHIVPAVLFRDKQQRQKVSERRRGFFVPNALRRHEIGDLRIHIALQSRVVDDSLEEQPMERREATERARACRSALVCQQDANCDHGFGNHLENHSTAESTRVVVPAEAHNAALKLRPGPLPVASGQVQRQPVLEPDAVVGPGHVFGDVGGAGEDVHGRCDVIDLAKSGVDGNFEREPEDILKQVLVRVVAAHLTEGPCRTEDIRELPVGDIVGYGGGCCRGCLRGSHFAASTTGQAGHPLLIDITHRCLSARVAVVGRIIAIIAMSVGVTTHDRLGVKLWTAPRFGSPVRVQHALLPDNLRAARFVEMLRRGAEADDLLSFEILHQVVLQNRDGDMNQADLGGLLLLSASPSRKSQELTSATAQALPGACTHIWTENRDLVPVYHLVLFSRLLLLKRPSFSLLCGPLCRSLFLCRLRRKAGRPFFLHRIFGGF